MQLLKHVLAFNDCICTCWDDIRRTSEGFDEPGRGQGEMRIKIPVFITFLLMCYFWPYPG